jgi:S1-C subfamily serine protease
MPTFRGVVVTDFLDGSPAADAELQRGMYLNRSTGSGTDF